MIKIEEILQLGLKMPHSKLMAQRHYDTQTQLLTDFDKGGSNYGEQMGSKKQILPYIFK